MLLNLLRFRLPTHPYEHLFVLYLARLRLMCIPEYVRLDRVEPALLGPLDQLRPHLRYNKHTLSGSSINQPAGQHEDWYW